MTNLRFGWLMLALFMLGGLGLEALHLWKAPFYLEWELRRELWILGHAHGALLALINIAFGVMARNQETDHRAAGKLLIAAGLLVPAGFLLGGLGLSESDPSLFIVLTPIGAIAAIVACVLTYRRLASARSDA